MLVANANVVGNANRAPQNAQNIDGEKSIGPALDWEVEIWEDEHPRETSDASVDNIQERIDGIQSVPSGKA
jgi:hypothetical protein